MHIFEDFDRLQKGEIAILIARAALSFDALNFDLRIRILSAVDDTAQHVVIGRKTTVAGNALVPDFHRDRDRLTV